MNKQELEEIVRSYPIIYGNENPGYVNGQFVIQGNISPRAVQIP